MCVDSSGIKRVTLFRTDLITTGGSERVMFEEAKWLERNGVKTYVLTFNFNDKSLFNGAYEVNVEQIGYRTVPKSPLLGLMSQIYDIFILRRKIIKINPDIIVSSNMDSCLYLYFATLLTPFSYVTHIHTTIFWGDNLLKYAFSFRKAFTEIRGSPVHNEHIPLRPPESSLAKKISREIYAVVTYLAVRKARKIFVWSNQMKWEVNKLYGKNATVLKGAFPSEIFEYEARRKVKEKLGLEDKIIILSINRLDKIKRIDILIKAFRRISEQFDNAVLIIGGTGPEERNLIALVNELKIQDKVKFVGYVKEEELWDYYLSCEIFVCPERADFDLTPYEALAFQKKVVWSSTMELDGILSKNKHIFPANLTVDGFAVAIEKALTTKVTGKNDLSMYTWDEYCKTLIKELEG